MSEHLTTETIERYQRRDVDEAQRRETDLHLAKCDACLNLVLSSESGLALTSLSEAFLPAANEPSFHLSPAELNRLASGEIAEVDRVICDSHLEICNPCDEELRKLATAANETDRLVGALPSRESISRPPIWESVWASLTPLRAFAVVALVGLIAVAIIQYRRQQSPSLTGGDVAGNGSPQTLAPSPTISPSTAAGAPATALVQIKDNTRDIRLEQDGTLHGLDDADDAMKKLVKAALSGESLAKPKVLGDLSSAPITTLGPSSGQTNLRLINPLGKVVSEARPTLRWRPLQNADGYVVSIYDENFNPVTKSPTLAKTEWTSSALRRGRNYSWDVTAFRNGQEIGTPSGPQAGAKFRVLEAEKLSALAKLRQRKPVSHLALGLAYAQAGLVAEAEREFRQLLKENPDSATAKNLLTTVQRWK